MIYILPNHFEKINIFTPYSTRGLGCPQRFQGSGGSQEGGETCDYEKLVSPPSCIRRLKAARQGVGAAALTISQSCKIHLHQLLFLQQEIRLNSICQQQCAGQ